jgi:flagellar protein FliL
MAGDKSKSGGLKRIIMMVVALVVLGGLGLGGFMAFKAMNHKAPKALPGEAAETADTAAKGEAEDADDEEEPHAGGGEHGGAGGPPVMVTRMIVNLDGPRKNAMLKAEISILFRDQELGKLATSDKVTPENVTIRSIVLAGLSGKTLEEVTDVESREMIRTEIKDKLNEKFLHRVKPKEGKKAKKPIKDVLVVDWAIQQ